MAANSKHVPPAAPAKSRLGRGLSSLIKVSIPETAPTPAIPAADKAANKAEKSAPEIVKIIETVIETGTPRMVPVAQIRPNPHQPRKTFTPQNLAELAESIKSNGIIQALVVRQQGDGYELIAGERRWRASQLAGLTEVPCFIRTVDGLTQAQMALVENIQREDLSPLERAEGYRTLLSQLGLTQHELAARLGEDRSSIANYVRLLDLIEPVKKMLRDGLLSLGHAKLLAGVTDVLEQEKIAKLVLSQGLSVRNLEKAILQSAGAPAPAKPAADGAAGRDAHYAELEKSIARQLGMRVQVKAGRSKGKGKLTIHYANLDQFDMIMGKLGVDAE